MLERKTILARLLAKENIEVRQGSRSTATFNVKQRILNLTAWKDMSKDLYDLMVGHEVGHALWTPPEGWHNACVSTAFPTSYANIVEDVRIERKVIDMYPGLLRNFKMGYKELLERDFFGLSVMPIEKLGFMDRLNIKAKCRDLIEVPFLADEKPYIDMVYAAETFEDVVAVCEAIAKFLREKKKNEKKEPKSDQPKAPVEQDPSESDKDSAESTVDSVMDEDQDSQEAEDETPTEVDSDSDDSEGPQSSDDFEESDDSIGSDDSEESDDSIGSDDSEESDDQDEDESVSSGSADSDDDSEESEDQDEADSNTDGAGGTDNSMSDPDVTSEGETESDTYTDDSFRNSEESLVEIDSRGRYPRYIDSVTKTEAEELVISYSKVLADRKNTRMRAQTNQNPYYSKVFREREEDIVKDFKEFTLQTKKVVGTMVKEFEMRKAAFQHARATTAKSGSLDLTKLASYKHNDDIFLRTTTLADAKSHGMIILLDSSGSMQSVMKNVIDQALVLTSFCRKVGIPFEVYSFTTCNGMHGYSSTRREEAERIVLDNVRMINHLSSNMSKMTYNAAVESLYKVYRQPLDYKYDGFGGTPTIEALAVLDHHIMAFKKKTGVQKMNLVMISDGQPQAAKISYNGDSLSQREIFTSRYKLGNTYVDVGINMNNQKLMIKALAKKHRMTTICYYIIERTSSLNRAHACDEKGMFRTRSESRSLLRKDGCMSVGCTEFDHFFVINGRQDAIDDEFEVADDASSAQIATAFKKHSKSKKQHRAIAVKFAEAIA